MPSACCHDLFLWSAGSVTVRGTLSPDPLRCDANLLIIINLFRLQESEKLFWRRYRIGTRDVDAGSRRTRWT